MWIELTLVEVLHLAVAIIQGIVLVTMIPLLHVAVEALILHRQVVVEALLSIAQVAAVRGVIPVVAVLPVHLLVVALLEARDDKIMII